MNVVFLDMDGVANNSPYLLGLPKDQVNRIVAPGSFDWALHLDPENVKRLERLIVATDAHLVISSDWRHYHTTMQIEDYLQRRGAPSAFVLDRCPDGDRGPSILDWLDMSRRGLKFAQVTSWIALDDCKDMGEAESRTVRTDPKVGLTDEDVDRALAMLGLTEEWTSQ